MQEDEMQENAEDIVVSCISCVRCGQEKEAYKDNEHLCRDCGRVEDTRVSHRRAHNEDWIVEARAAEVELWERQPRETDLEWGIWCSYRDQYPAKKPTYKGVAEKLGTTIGNVRSVAKRWEFHIRMQAWGAHCDRLTRTQREKEIVAMNQQHITMATRLNEKLLVAIDSLDPEAVTPSQLSALMKTASELEKKARLDVKSTEENLRDLRDEAMGKELTVKNDSKTAKKGDLQQVVDILAKAGVLGDVVGIKTTTTTTTELVGKENDCIEIRPCDPASLGSDSDKPEEYEEEENDEENYE